MKKISIASAFILLISCGTPNDQIVQGKVERESLSVVTKIAGRISEVRVKEGDFVKKGDTLAILDFPEVDAKINQANGALISAKAQYDMALKGATSNQLVQLQAKRDAIKEQFELAQKSYIRFQNMVNDSLISQQTFDEVFAKYQAAKSQLTAVKAELEEAKNGARKEQQVMALGQQERALGAIEEIESAHSERYVIAPQDMSIETITLQVGELALPGYALFSGYLSNSVYFRFTLPESKLKNIKKEQEITVVTVYNNQKHSGKVMVIKQLSNYANIATAYPDYEFQESLFEIKVIPTNLNEADQLITKTTVKINL